MEWVRIKDFEQYAVNQIGVVRSYKRKIHLDKLLQKDKDGYLVTMLYNETSYKLRSVHRLVAEAFIPNPENKKWVNHKDGNKANNNVSNLEWSTISENHLHAHRVLKRNKADVRGVKNPNCKLTIDQVKEIISRHNSGESDSLELAREFGINRNYVYQLSNNKMWKSELENSLK